ncbi:MAG TPA: response regulator [Candidatus Paceibacterota bacterium]|nr:response regulator [Candidatus Paceibacterota bacterium]HMP19168.1 response regulator [Candidatus Paceibacterota bacterium]HMP85219.1 response regulator [Candidatus Paceibacterota bacterium]
MNENQKIKIMIVDDDKFLLDMYSRKFSQKNYEPYLAIGPEMAIEKLKNKEFEPDIFLFDLIMPKMDGIEMFKIIKSENLSPNSVNIILSNQGQQSDLEKVEGLDIDGYIIKALHTPTEVVEKVTEIFNNKKQK